MGDVIELRSRTDGVFFSPRFGKRAVCVAELHIDFAAKVEMLAGLARDLAGEGAGLAEYAAAIWLQNVQHEGETAAALIRARFHEEKP